MRKKSSTEKDSTTPITNKTSWRLTHVKVLKNFMLEVEFVDGTRGIVEMGNLIRSDNAGVFSKLRDEYVFQQVYLEHGVATWPGEIDLAPDAMHDAISKYGKFVLS